MKNTLKLRILTGDNIVYQNDEISFVTIPTSDGEITVLANHIPLISTIKTGEIKIGNGKEVVACAISKGILEVREHSTVIILAERAEMAHLLDVKRAEEAYKKALELKHEEKMEEDRDNAKATGLIEKELNRIKVGSKWGI